MVTDLEQAVLCRCPSCWCMELAPAWGPVCEACTAGNHPGAEPVTPANAGAPAPRKCGRHRWTKALDPEACERCGQVRDLVAARRSRNNRHRGGRHELAVARAYGGTKVGPLGGPADVVGTLFAIQVKTHQGPPPARLLRLMAAMETGAGGRVPVVLDRYLVAGKPAVDLVTVRGGDWIALHGKDGSE